MEDDEIVIAVRGDPLPVVSALMRVASFLRVDMSLERTDRYRVSGQGLLAFCNFLEHRTLSPDDDDDDEDNGFELSRWHSLSAPPQLRAAAGLRGFMIVAFVPDVSTTWVAS